MTIRRRCILPRLTPAVCFIVFIVLSAAAHAQAVETAAKLSEIHVMAEGSIIHTAYGPGRDSGIVAAIDYARFFRFPIEPSLEIRGTYAPKGESVGEKVALGGVRGDLRLRLIPERLHPYVNVLFGVGEIDFINPQQFGNLLYSSDNSVVVDLGAGLTYDLPFHGFALQAEYQYQHWNIGDQTSPNTFTPYAFNAGIRYLIPFRPHTHR